MKLLHFTLLCFCVECYNRPGGFDYRGHLNIGISGRQCQRWESQHPHSHTMNSAWLGVSDLADAENYCRTPGQSERPWCYTVDPEVRWEYCDLPVCPSSGVISALYSVCCTRSNFVFLQFWRCAVAQCAIFWANGAIENRL